MVETRGNGDPEVIGPYQVLARLGRGGFGTVYVCTHARTGEHAAVKVVHPHLSDAPEFRVRFRREVAAISRVGSEYAPRVLDDKTSGEPRGWPPSSFRAPRSPGSSTHPGRCQSPRSGALAWPWPRRWPQFTRPRGAPGSQAAERAPGTGPPVDHRLRPGAPVRPATSIVVASRDRHLSVRRARAVAPRPARRGYPRRHLRVRCHLALRRHRASPARGGQRGAALPSGDPRQAQPRQAAVRLA